MPAGTPYFAWIDVTETTFGAEHERWDEQIFSFTLKQDEGDPASLTLTVLRPRNTGGDPIGLLGPGRKIWCWFALDCGPGPLANLIRFRGRLVGTPTNFFEELVTLDFVAKPADLVAQKDALAATLRVLPYYDETLIDPARRTDPEVVLEARSAIWAFDRETHIITISDEITGEDGLVLFDMSDAAHTVLYEGLSCQIGTGPLARVNLTAEFTWTTTSGGTVDLTSYLLANWPRATVGSIHHPSTPLGIQLDEGSWPKPGASLGSGWTVADSTAKNLFDYTVKTETTNSQVTTIFPDGDSVKGTSSSSTATINSGVAFGVRKVTTNDLTTWKTENDPDGGSYTSSFNRNTTIVDVRIGIQEIKPTLVATYAANRQMTEKVSIELLADVQPVMTDPEDGEALIIDDVRSVNLSEAIDSVVPIGDQSRQSYITTARGNQAIEHLILLMRANLLKRARVIEFTFAPRLERMPEITLRKSAFLVEPRVGEATGKIIGYSIALDGSDGKIKCEIKIGCAIGYGGTTTVDPGTPSYAEIAYCGADYQQFIGRTVVVTGTNTSVSFSPPSYVPTGGINFQTSLTAADVIEVPLSVQWGTAPAASTLLPAAVTGKDVLATATEFVKEYWLPQFETQATFKLKDVTGDLTSDYTIATSVLNIPTGYDLEAT